MMRFWNDIPPLWRCECVVHKRERPLIAWNKVIFMHTFYFSQYSSASYLYGIRSFTRTFSAFWRSQVFLSASKAANTYLNATYEHFTLYDFYLTSKIPCSSGYGEFWCITFCQNKIYCNFMWNKNKMFCCANQNRCVSKIWYNYVCVNGHWCICHVSIIVASPNSILHCFQEQLLHANNITQHDK